jgi:hypothetical protein
MQNIPILVVDVFNFILQIFPKLLSVDLRLRFRSLCHFGYSSLPSKLCKKMCVLFLQIPVEHIGKINFVCYTATVLSNQSCFYRTSPSKNLKSLIRKLVFVQILALPPVNLVNVLKTNIVLCYIIYNRTIIPALI